MKLKQLQLIHTTFCCGVILFALVALFINKDSLFFSTKLADSGAYNLLFPMVGLISISIGIFLFNKMIIGISESADFSKKFEQYQTATLIKLAFFEAGAILNTVACLLTGNTIFMLFAGISLLALITSRPIKSKTISDLQLQYPETENL